MNQGREHQKATWRSLCMYATGFGTYTIDKLAKSLEAILMMLERTQEPLQGRLLCL